MDMTILLWLQELRYSLGPGFEYVMAAFSDLAAGPVLVMVPFWIYWCRNKRLGQMTMTGTVFAQSLNQLIKNTACVPRPWLRDSRIHPAEKALPKATGYSFPSGHTVLAGSITGTIGHEERHSYPQMTAVCYVFIAVIAFSRMFLGCHTPQDVLVALIESVLVIRITGKIIDWTEEHPEKDMTVLIGGLFFTVIYFLYMILKPYPEADMNNMETLLEDGYAVSGTLAGYFIGWYLERRYIRFKTQDLDEKKRVIRFLIGGILCGSVYAAGSLVLKPLLGVLIAKLIRMFLLMICAVYITPAVFTALERRNVQRHI